MMELKYVRTRPYPERKVKLIKEFQELLQKYKKYLVFSFENIPANLMQEIRREMRKRNSVVKVIKNTLAKKATEMLNRNDLKALLDKIEGQIAWIFTNGNLFEITQYLESKRIKLPLRPGLILPQDIIIRKGPTGIRGVSEISDLRAAGMNIRVIDGEIVVWEDFLLGKKGQRLSARDVKVMQIFNINPFEAWPKVKFAFDEGVIIPREILVKPIDKWKEEILQALQGAFNLAVNAAFPTHETVELILQEAYMQALNIAMEAGLPTKDTAEMTLEKALQVAHILSEYGFSMAVSTAIQVAKEIIKEVKNKKPDLITKDLEEIIS